MIMIFAVVIGVMVGWLKAAIERMPFEIPELRHIWLVLLASLPQYLVFFLPITRERIDENWIPFILVGSQIILLVFVWLNRRAPVFWVLGTGLLLNFTVISLNGGWMPISPGTLEAQAVHSNYWQIGSRLGFTKDIVLEKSDTVLWLLSDILTLPGWIPYRVAFSIGDILISAGVIGFFVHNNQTEHTYFADFKEEPIQ